MRLVCNTRRSRYAIMLHDVIFDAPHRGSIYNIVVTQAEKNGVKTNPSAAWRSVEWSKEVQIIEMFKITLGVVSHSDLMSVHHADSFCANIKLRQREGVRRSWHHFVVQFFLSLPVVFASLSTTGYYLSALQADTRT